MAKRNNGEGSWGKKTINGYKYFTYRTPEGKTIYGKTQKEIKEKLSKQIKHLEISPKTLFGDYILDWLTFKQGEIEQTTYQTYEDLINSMVIKFGFYNISTKQISQLSPKVFQKYLNSLALQYSRSSITKIWVIIKQCLKYGELQNELPSNLATMVKVPLESKVAVKKKEIPFLTMEQANIFYDMLEYKDERNISRFKTSNNAHALVLILYTGMRVGELIALKWKNVDLDNKRIHIVESSANIKENGKTISVDKAPKTESSVRYVPLPDRAIEMLEYFRKIRKNEYVCISKNGMKMNRRNISHTLNSMCKYANLPQLNIHALRHSYGSILLSQGVDIKIISELLGHSNITTTYNVYIGIREDDKQSAVEQAFNLNI